MCDHLVEAPPRVARRDHVGVAVVGELLGGELAHRLEQPEPATERAGLDDQHRPVDQVTEQIVDVDGPDRSVASATIASAATRSNGPAKIDRHPEHRLLRRRQQVVRPLDGRPQRPMPLDAGPPAAGQEPQTIVEPLHQLRRREAPGARRGQLDRERDAVEAPADLLDVVPAGIRIERPPRLPPPAR